jgi:hypothetical protein
MEKRELRKLENDIKKLDIPEPRKHLDIHTARWLLRTYKLNDETMRSLLVWLRENDPS